jgi:TatD DNase family protein
MYKNNPSRKKESNKIFDAHCHIYMLPDKEIEKAILNAKKLGVEKIISNSTSFQSNQYNLKISKIFPNVKPALGLYPLNALELSEDELKKAFSFIENHLKYAIAIGEIGMDYKFAKSDNEREKQKEIFKKFIQMGKKYNKPLIVHSRYAQSQTLKILEEEGVQKVLMHSFIDSQKLMNKAKNLGYYISVGIIILENVDIQKRIKEFPLENLLFETDSPMLFSGKKTLPQDVLKIAKKIAELKNIPIEKIINQQENNFNTLFGIN